MRATVLLFILSLWIGVLGAWIACNRSTSWQDWLANMKFLPGSSGLSKKAARPEDLPKELAYLGDGRAELGDYSIRVFDPITGTTLRTDFRLEGLTACAAEDKFAQFMKGNHRFIREQVMVTVRNCQPHDLVDPDLRLLEKKVVSRVNRALGRRFLKSAHIKNFYLLESTDNSVFVER